MSTYFFIIISERFYQKITHREHSWSWEFHLSDLHPRTHKKFFEEGYFIPCPVRLFSLKWRRRDDNSHTSSLLLLSRNLTAPQIAKTTVRWKSMSAEQKLELALAVYYKIAIRDWNFFTSKISDLNRLLSQDFELTFYHIRVKTRSRAHAYSHSNLLVQSQFRVYFYVCSLTVIFHCSNIVTHHILCLFVEELLS